MKKIIVLALVVLTGTLAATAQEKRDTIRPKQPVAGQHKQHKDRMELKNALGLSKEQTQQLKDINGNFKKQAQDIKSDSTLTPAQKKEKGKGLAVERNKKINGILTPDQQAKYRQWTQEKIKEKKQHKKGAGAKDETSMS